MSRYEKAIQLLHQTVRVDYGNLFDYQFSEIAASYFELSSI
jgi:hypothetical protein